MRSVATQKGVITAFVRSDTDPAALHVTATDAATPPRPDQSIKCALPTDAERRAAYRLALGPLLDNGELGAFEVTTEKQGAAPAKAEGSWLHFALEGAPVRIDTEAAVVIRPRFEEIAIEEGCAGETEKRFAGFEIVAMAKAPRDDTAVERTAKSPEPMLERKTERLDLPAEAKEGVRYGVLLQPRWTDERLAGFDARLISMPKEEEPGADE